MAKIIKHNDDLLKDTSYLVDNLRARREKECFSVINRGALWYDTLSVSQKEELKVWYSAWLKVTDTLQAPVKPSWL